jgi:hypothetical protein
LNLSGICSDNKIVSVVVISRSCAVVFVTEVCVSIKCKYYKHSHNKRKCQKTIESVTKSVKQIENRPIDTAAIRQSPTILVDNIVPPVEGKYNSTVELSPQLPPNMYI